MSARRLLIVLAALGGILLAPAAAYAEPGYPIDPPASNVSEGTVPAGEPVTFTGRGFLPGEPIEIDIDFQATGAAFHTGGAAARPAFVTAALKTITASPTGTFSTPITLEQSGTATLTATGTISGVTVTEQVTAVVADDDEPSDNSGDTDDAVKLPVTGSSGDHWLGVLSLGFGAILLGGLLVLGTLRLRGRRVS